MQTPVKMVRVAAPDLRCLATELMTAAGADQDHARITAELLVEADLKGIGVQGVDYLYYILDCLGRGIIDGRAKPTVERETPATAFIDGHGGMGQPAAMLAVQIARRKAAETGTASVAVGNSTDIFMIGAYSERLARSGLIAMVMTSGPPLVHPYGGVERLLSTNPISIAIPRKGDDPLVLDMATSALASSRIRQAIYADEAVAPGTGIGPDGAPTTDASQIRKGAISPLAGHKGFGLALCVGLICGPLTGSGVGPQLAGWQATGDTKTQGHFFYAVDPRAFGDYSDFIDAAEGYIDTIKNSRKAPGVEEIRVPGERAAAEHRRQRRSGVRLLATTWDVLSEYAQKLDVQLPKHVR